ncbi:MAG: hypothetical protein GY781_21815, partial [Gammaproteobacteria bacterium]|nr:hypothetical protein [Gammaproteobacteria bacterium]
MDVVDLRNANTMINTSQKQIRDLQNRINILYPNPIANPPAQPTNQLGFDAASIAGIIAAMQGVAQSPQVELPKFAGELSKYNGFKLNFKYLIQQVSGPQTLWATHLANSLEGEAKQYAGDATNWFDKYNELWETLDSKYANRWLLATETIRNFFSKPPPKDNLQAVKDFFFDQLQALNNVLALKMEVEHIGVNHIIEKLPDKYRSELQNGLRVLQPGQTNAAFSRKIVKDVYNDTIGVKTEQPTPPKGTLSFLAQTTGGSAPCSQGLQIPHPNNNPYSMCQPQYQTQVQQAQNEPQAWEGRGNFHYHNGSPFRS